MRLQRLHTTTDYITQQPRHWFINHTDTHTHTDTHSSVRFQSYSSLMAVYWHAASSESDSKTLNKEWMPAETPSGKMQNASYMTKTGLISQLLKGNSKEQPTGVLLGSQHTDDTSQTHCTLTGCQPTPMTELIASSRQNSYILHYAFWSIEARDVHLWC